MAKNFIENGEAIQITAQATVKSGEAVFIGDLVGVAIADIALGSLGACSTVGVWEFAAKAADNIEQGATVYWDSGEKKVTTTKGSNKVLGKAWSASPNGAEIVAVKINA